MTTDSSKTSDSTKAAHTPSTGKANVHRGSCHCGAVRFEVECDLGKGATRCNCSICTKIATTGVIVPPGALKILSGEADLVTYEWGARISQRYFCKHCGVHGFARGHLAELGGDFAAVNVNCLDDIDVSQLSVGHWDGRHNNWEAGMRPLPWPVFATS